MSVLWLRIAAALYGCGLLYALIYLFRKSTMLFQSCADGIRRRVPFFIGFNRGASWAEKATYPWNNFYETS